MCEPTTLAAASFAASSMGTIAEYQGQKATAKAGQANAMTAYRDNQASLNSKHQLDTAAFGQDAEEQARQTLRAESTARVVAGEKGVMGNSIDALFRELGGNGDRNQSSIYENYRRSGQDIQAQQRSNVNQTTSTLNQFAKPSALAAGLKIGGAAMNSYTGYKGGTFGKHTNMWS